MSEHPSLFTSTALPSSYSRTNDFPQASLVGILLHQSATKKLIRFNLFLLFIKDFFRFTGNFVSLPFILTSNAFQMVLLARSSAFIESEMSYLSGTTWTHALYVNGLKTMSHRESANYPNVVFFPFVIDCTSAIISRTVTVSLDESGIIGRP